jgi:acyl-CoA synthetase (AMP-forming)/AMP-acid ligase II
MEYNSWSQLLESYTKQHPDKLLLTYTKDDRKISWKQFYNNTLLVANLFKNSRIQKGDRISILTRNTPEFIYSFFAAMHIGAIFNPINPDSIESDIEFILNDSSSKIVIVDKQNYDKIKKIRNKIPPITFFGNEFNTNEIVILENHINENKTIENTQINPDSNLSNDCLIMYSSGTTGKPKGIVLTQSNIMHESFSITRHWQFNEKTIGMCTLPLFFSGGLIPGFLATFVGHGSLIMQNKFSKTNFFQNIEKYQITYTNVVPTIFSILLNPPIDIEKYNLTSLKLLATSAAPLPVELAKRFELQYNIPIIEAYGLTENSCWCSLNTPKNRLLGSIGKAIDVCEIAIANNAGNHLAANKEGEIIVRGQIIFPRYWNNKNKTQESLKDGWLHTGDLGHLDNTGNLFINGRIKEIIIKGGENISPKAIDEVFYKHDAIIDAATIGIPDNIYGEEIKTYVVTNRNITTSDLLQYAQQHISEFHCPKHIEIIDQIPKGPSGKLLRRKLLEMHLTSASQ